MVIKKISNIFQKNISVHYYYCRYRNYCYVIFLNILITHFFMNKKIPITILTGFLGSGKTTLLNHIIRNANGKKIAVVENEFGSAGIDADLIEKSTEEIVEISNGCMCCTVRKDFIEAIERLLASGKLIDHIIIECS